MDRVRDLVAAGDVSVVLAQDRDRFAREPAYHYLLRREFEEHGTKINIEDVVTAWVVQVEDIASHFEQVPRSTVNRLLWESSEDLGN